MSGLLIACLAVYLFMSITVFKSDKTQLVFDINRSQAANLISEIETQFGSVSEKLKLFALLPHQLQTRMADDLFSEGSDVVSVGIFKTNPFTPVRSFSQGKFLETYGLNEADFTKRIQSEGRIPLERIRKNGEAIWNASIESGPPLVGYGRLVVLQDASGAAIDNWIVVGLVKPDRFLKMMSMVRLSETVVANADGEILIHPDMKTMNAGTSISGDAFFGEVRDAKIKVSVVIRDVAGEKMLVAYAKGFNDQIYVISKTSEARVFQVVKDLSENTFLFGLIVLTLVILAAFLLSRSLTQNIAILADRMEGVSKGDLTSQIHLRGRDETVKLAAAFNHMIVDLKDSRDALEKMNRELDQKVKERTAQLEIQNQKVKEAQEALLRTTRLASVGEIAGQATHELLNPLTILLTRVGLMQKRVSKEGRDALVLLDEMRVAWKREYEEGGFASLVQSWQVPSKVFEKRNLFQEDVENLGHVSKEWKCHSENLEKDIQFIKMEGERIGKIVHGMRRLGSFKSDAKPYSMHAILDDCCQIMADLFDQKQFIIDKQLHAAQDECLVDRDEVIQAVTNLMRNSLQALADVKEARHKLRMTLRTRSEAEQILIDIEDNGAGVQPDDQVKLFQGSFTTKPREEGTGLGLGISRRFIREFGGDIEFISSLPMEKTVFRIVLPLHTEKSQQGAVA